ncbi:site-specific integrase [Bradyrhizobium sp. 5.13L]
MLDKFEARWPVGTTPRLVYSAALYFGHRRSDVTRVKPAEFKQKTGKALVLPIHPNLQDALDAIRDLEERSFVVMTARGKPFSAKGLTVACGAGPRPPACRRTGCARRSEATGAAHGDNPGAPDRQHRARRALQPGGRAGGHGGDGDGTADELAAPEAWLTGLANLPTTL